jgi:pseudaminic acid synthase
MKVNGKKIGAGQPAYIVAELSANHGGSLEKACDTIRAAAKAGADAIKVQTYRADTVTIDCDNEYFTIKGGTIWDGANLYSLYEQAYTPWEWHAELRQTALECGIGFFSTPFDNTAVDFLEELNVPCHKVASFELVDLPLLRKIGSTGKPVIMSTGMASKEEIREAVEALKSAGCGELILLKCTSSYPADPADANLRTIPDLAASFGCPVGLSDHTTGIAVSVASVALGACLLEKHFTLSRADGGPDSSFSLEPAEFKQLVEEVRIAEQALGTIRYGGTASEEKSKAFRRSLFVVQDIKKGERFTSENVRVIRPADGLMPRELDRVLGKAASQDIAFGTPLRRDLIA